MPTPADATPPATQAKERWHVNKNVPVALIVVLVGQIMTGVWFASGLMANDEEQDKSLIAHDRRLSTIESSNTSTRLSVLEAQMSDIRSGVAESNRKLDRLIERNGGARRGSGG